MASRRSSGISTITVSPDSAHSFRVFLRSISRRLSGIVLMAMKLLAFHNQFVADLPTDDENNDLVTPDIIQGTQVSCPQFELNQGIGSQSLDRFRRCRGLVF